MDQAYAMKWPLHATITKLSGSHKKKEKNALSIQRLKSCFHAWLALAVPVIIAVVDDDVAAVVVVVAAVVVGSNANFNKVFVVKRIISTKQNFSTLTKKEM